MIFHNGNLKQYLMKLLNLLINLPTLKYISKRNNIKFYGSCLKQDKNTFNHGKIVNIYIVSDLQSTRNYNADITLENCLFGAVKITK